MYLCHWSICVSFKMLGFSRFSLQTLLSHPLTPPSCLTDQSEVSKSPTGVNHSFIFKHTWIIISIHFRSFVQPQCKTTNNFVHVWIGVHNPLHKVNTYTMINVLNTIIRNKKKYLLTYRPYVNVILDILFCSINSSV